MAKCPACSHDVTIPSAFSLAGWSRLSCPQCKSRLEMKPRPVGFLLLPVLSSLLWISRFGHNFAVLAEILVALATVAVVLILVVRPQVRLRRLPLPKPGVRLNVDNP